MKPVFQLLIFSLCILFAGQDLRAQDTKSIILIDGIATEVVMDADGKILQVVRKLPDYMKEFDHTPKNPSSSQEEVYQADYNLNPNASSSGSSELLSIGAFRIVYFKTGSKFMSQATKNKLDEIANKVLKTGQIVMLNSFYNQSESKSKNLVFDRAADCKDYLINKGVPQSNILYSIEAAEKERAKINVFIK